MFPAPSRLLINVRLCCNHLLFSTLVILMSSEFFVEVRHYAALFTRRILWRFCLDNDKAFTWKLLKRLASSGIKNRNIWWTDCGPSGPQISDFVGETFSWDAANHCASIFSSRFLSVWLLFRIFTFPFGRLTKWTPTKFHRNELLGLTGSYGWSTTILLLFQFSQPLTARRCAPLCAKQSK